MIALRRDESKLVLRLSKKRMRCVTHMQIDKKKKDILPMECVHGHSSLYKNVDKRRCTSQHDIIDILVSKK